MKISYVVTECRDKISPDCTKTFNREVGKRGRPQVNCFACKAYKAPTAPRATSESKSAEPASRERLCPCGSTFTVSQGRGRKATKCASCREAGTVYRTNDDGMIEAIQQDQLSREQQERDEARGRERAANLFEMMKPLIAKRSAQVSTH